MTLTKIKNLTNSQLDCKVAELNGWEKGPKRDIKLGLFGKISPMICWHCKTEKDNWVDFPPYFTVSLDEMHEVIKNMPKNRLHFYFDCLLELAKKNHGGAFEATARQRAEAFVFAMEQKLSPKQKIH